MIAACIPPRLCTAAGRSCSWTMTPRLWHCWSSSFVGTAGTHLGTRCPHGFRQRQPDLVLLDIILGPSSGLQVLKEIRQLSAVPVIMLTAMDDTQDKVRGLQMGADDYITKPFNNQELMARIEVQFRRANRRSHRRHHCLSF